MIAPSTPVLRAHDQSETHNRARAIATRMRQDGRAPLTVSRQLWVVAHRWAGLSIALFLVIVGFTGALLPWNEELTRLSRPSLSAAAPPSPGARVLDGITLAERIEAQTGAKVGFVDLDIAPDHVATVFVNPRGKTALPYDVVWADPYTGAIRLKYRYGKLADGPQTIMAFLYRLHFQLALGAVGSYVMGAAALIWTLDCFVGFYLTLPIRRRPIPGKPGSAPGWWSRWRPAWLVRWRGGSYKLTFDLHRAGGLWVWPMLFVFAWSSVGLNLPQVADPVMSVFGAKPYERLPDAAKPLPDPPLTLRDAQARGETLLREIGAREGFRVLRPSGVSYDPSLAAYRYTARSTLDVADRGGRTTVYLSGADGRFLKFDPPVDRNPANAFMGWLNMLHFAEILGLPYRAFVSLVGVLVVTLSVTGVLIWMKKRSARLLKGHRLTRTAAGKNY